MYCVHIYIYVYTCVCVSLISPWFPQKTPGRFTKQGEQHKMLHQQGGKKKICANLLGGVDRHDESDDWDFTVGGA